MAADPIVDYARPDIEALVWQTVGPLSTSKGDITSWAYAANDARTPAGWLSIVSVQVDVRARYKQGASVKADLIRRLLLDLVASPWSGGVINRVDIIEGPFFLADPDGRPRYVTRADIYTHPRPSARLNKESAR